MSYDYKTDFLALARQTSGGVRIERMPGMDYVVEALSRADMFKTHVGVTPPTTDQPITVWIRPAPGGSWTAESQIWLWDLLTQQYMPATNALWASIFVSAAAVQTIFQSVTTETGAANTNTTLLAVQRANPTQTTLSLPSVFARSSGALRIVDWSTGIAAEHEISLVPEVGQTIMQLPSWKLISTPYASQGVTLFPSTNLSGWVIAP